MWLVLCVSKETHFGQLSQILAGYGGGGGSSSWDGGFFWLGWALGGCLGFNFWRILAEICNLGVLGVGVPGGESSVRFLFGVA